MLKKNSLGLRFPADSTSTSGSNGLGIIYNAKRAANELGGEIDCRAPQKGERNCVYDDTGPSHDRMLKLTGGRFSVLGDRKTIMDHNVLILESALLCELHFILISMAAARFDGDSQS